jgi:hypothetical protein
MKLSKTTRPHLIGNKFAVGNGKPRAIKSKEVNLLIQEILSNYNPEHLTDLLEKLPVAIQLGYIIKMMEITMSYHIHSEKLKFEREKFLQNKKSLGNQTITVRLPEDLEDE